MAMTVAGLDDDIMNLDASVSRCGSCALYFPPPSFPSSAPSLPPWPMENQQLLSQVGCGRGKPARKIPKLVFRIWYLVCWVAGPAFVTSATCQWLMGPCQVNDIEMEDGSFQASGVAVERCRYLEQSGCVSVCVHTCKLPTQAFMMDHMGIALAIEPNYNDYSCQVPHPIPTPHTPSPPHPHPAHPLMSRCMVWRAVQVRCAPSPPSLRPRPLHSLPLHLPHCRGSHPMPHPLYAALPCVAGIGGSQLVPPPPPLGVGCPPGRG